MAGQTTRYLAHISDDGERAETVYQHLTEVAEMAAGFAEKFGNADWAYAAGMLHDIGKYSQEFQRRLLGNGPRVDHATAGAYVAVRELKDPLIAYCIAGHHSGLPDGGVVIDEETTLNGRLNKAKNGLIPKFKDYAKEISVVKPKGTPIDIDQSRQNDTGYATRIKFSYTFLTRMIYSCLVDADYLCTERFMRGEPREPSSTTGLATMRDDLEKKLAEFYPPKTRINAIRCGVLDDCKRSAQMDPGVFSLTVPTGGGKTYALMRFALHHATMPGRRFDRVICVEPYTSIIEQNAAVYRDVFGDAQVLEHHSNYDFSKHGASDAQNDDTFGDPMRLAAENWDVPLVVTTNVQLFETLFANKPSRCRKLHNIARSVIVLDEAQMIPVKYLEPCVRALSELVKRYGCTVVLCTATQPALNEFFEREGISVQEIASHPRGLVEELKRVQYQTLGKLKDDALAERIASERQALCIVNSRKQARALYDLLVASGTCDKEAVFHLSTLMYPLHRTRAIAQIRKRLRDGLPCTVISTSLVEAGVDFDFTTVFRAIAGIDSMVQAAGRCNREMRNAPEESTVYLFDPEESYALPIEVSQCAEVAGSVEPKLQQSDKFVEIDSIDMVRRYFSTLYYHKNLDANKTLEQLSCYGYSGRIPSIPFAKVASQFRIVEDGSYSVIIPSNENGQDVTRLREGDLSRGVMRRLGRWGVSVYKNDRDALLRAEVIKPVAEDLFLLKDPSRYSEEVGLDLYVEGGEAVFL